MKGILAKFKEKIISADDAYMQENQKAADNLISLGVLMWVVAQADDQFLPEETEAIVEILKKYSDISDSEMPVILRSIEEAALQRIDVHSFTSEVAKDLERPAKIEIIEHLFRVGCADNDLDEKEHDTIRLISGLFRLDHNEFISAKIKVKKEFGMDTAGL